MLSQSCRSNAYGVKTATTNFIQKIEALAIRTAFDSSRENALNLSKILLGSRKTGRWNFNVNVVHRS